MDKSLQPLEPEDISLHQHLDRETLVERLKIFIADLLQHDFGKLCNLMYRHDVNERRFNEALSLPDDESRSEAIANLVIDREMQKIKIREMYARFKNKNLIDE